MASVMRDQRIGITGLDHTELMTAAIQDWAAAAYLDRGGYWYHAVVTSRKACENFGLAILVFDGVVGVNELEELENRIWMINQMIEARGLYKFNDMDQGMAVTMQRTCDSDAPFRNYDMVDSENAVRWAKAYWDMTMRVLSEMLAKRR